MKFAYVSNALAYVSAFFKAVEGHFVGCAAFGDTTEKARCFCEARVYLYMLIIGVVIIIAEVAASQYSGSLGLEADAWHIFTDTMSDLTVIIVALFVAFFRDGIRINGLLINENLVRASGGIIQAALLFLAAYIIGDEVFARLGHPKEVNPYWMIVVGFIVGKSHAWRHRILHMRGTQDHVTHHGQSRHVLIDKWSSYSVSIGGVGDVLSPHSQIDTWLSAMLAIGAVVLGVITAYEAITNKAFVGEEKLTECSSHHNHGGKNHHHHH